MSYKTFDSWQLAQDQYFVDWVLHPDVHSQQFWESFLQENPGKIQDIMMAKELVGGLHHEATSELGGEDYVQLFERILATKRKKEQKVDGTFRLKISSGLLKYAAILALVFSVVLVWYANERRTTPRVVYKTVESPIGSHVTTRLSDGTRVKLNSGSKVRYQSSFEPNEPRVIFLEGEAFFEVTKDPTRPFQVISDYVVTEVLGTSFNVMAYPDDEVVAVAVAEGKVKVSGTEMLDSPFEHELLALQESRLNTATHQSEKRNLEDDATFSWVDWKLICQDETLEVILKRVERWYGVELEIGKEVNLQEKYTGVFDNDPLKVILEAFKSHGAFDYQVQADKKVKIYKR